MANREDTYIAMEAHYERLIDEKDGIITSLVSELNRITSAATDMVLLAEPDSLTDANTLVAYKVTKANIVRTRTQILPKVMQTMAEIKRRREGESK